MSIYTDIDLCCKLKPETSQITLEDLRIWLGLVSSEDVDPSKLYFATFDEHTHSYRGAGQRALESNSNQYFLTLRAKIKNYHRQIEHFLEFLAPHCDYDGYVGYMRDEAAENPTLIFIRNDKVIYRTILEYTDVSFSADRK